MANDFNKHDIQLIWQSHPYCAKCGSNQGCSFHHNYSRRMPHTASMYNAICLCVVCHKEADAHNTGSRQSKEFQQELLKLIFNQVTNSYYEVKQVDKDFLKYIDDDVQQVLNLL